MAKYFWLSSSSSCCLLPGSILVHCSAGVGRTGTFLAVYKLWLDYINPKVNQLSVFTTVLALRRQRCLMVQKKEQYAYIAKCLRFWGSKKSQRNALSYEMKNNFIFSFIISTEEGDYYES